MDPNSLRLLHLFALLGVGLFALVFGSWRERTGALAFVGSSLAASFVAATWPTMAFFPIIILDGLCLIVFLRLCWKSPHPWPIWAMACLGLNLMSELIASPVMKSWALMTALLIAGYGVLLALLIGTISVLRQRSVAAKGLKSAAHKK